VHVLALGVVQLLDKTLLQVFHFRDFLNFTLDFQFLLLDLRLVGQARHVSLAPVDGLLKFGELGLLVPDLLGLVTIKVLHLLILNGLRIE
jgi:hypothetical protein